MKLEADRLELAKAAALAASVGQQKFIRPVLQCVHLSTIGNQQPLGKDEQ